jgi:hypothetical protein
MTLISDDGVSDRIITCKLRCTTLHAPHSTHANRSQSDNYASDLQNMHAWRWRSAAMRFAFTDERTSLSIARIIHMYCVQYNLFCFFPFARSPQYNLGFIVWQLRSIEAAATMQCYISSSAHPSPARQMHTNRALLLSGSFFLYIDTTRKALQPRNKETIRSKRQQRSKSSLQKTQQN